MPLACDSCHSHAGSCSFQVWKCANDTRHISSDGTDPGGCCYRHRWCNLTEPQSRGPRGGISLRTAGFRSGSGGERDECLVPGRWPARRARSPSALKLPHDKRPARARDRSGRSSGGRLGADNMGLMRVAARRPKGPCRPTSCDVASDRSPEAPRRCHVRDTSSAPTQECHADVLLMVSTARSIARMPRAGALR